MDYWQGAHTFENKEFLNCKFSIKYIVFYEEVIFLALFLLKIMQSSSPTPTPLPSPSPSPYYFKEDKIGFGIA